MNEGCMLIKKKTKWVEPPFFYACKNGNVNYLNI